MLNVLQRKITRSEAAFLSLIDLWEFASFPIQAFGKAGLGTKQFTVFYHFVTIMSIP